MGSRSRVALALVLLAVGFSVAGRAGAQGFEDVDEGHAPIAWVGSVATSIFYTPTKVAYAALGGAVGGLAWVLTGFDTEAVSEFWDITVRGSYWITPSMLEGREPVRFFGP
ncbi:MAG: hypothetical protein KatS3mg076_1117 [Candidatus Binatia bacterium]|nr:MAG: hypothetical protein KatS3mg076_1117 [Candidatus Binatia bacterium]